MNAEGQCWLCGRWSKLTQEHIPPRSAFNNRPVLLYNIERRSTLVGRLEWQGRRESGLIAISLCGECNSRCGGQYGGHYVEFIRAVAERVEGAPDGATVWIPSVERPLSVLKSIMQSFVSANGPAFVRANPWIRKFLRNSRNNEWPSDAFLYVFGTNARGGRKSGVAAFYEATTRRIRNVAEFTFWPLGTVFAFDELDDRRLTPIHHWSSFDYGFKGKVDLRLTVNPVATAYPVDFRDMPTVLRQREEQAEPIAISQETIDKMIESAQQKSGKTDKKDWFLSVRTPPSLTE